MTKLTQTFVKMIAEPGSYQDSRGLMLRVSKNGTKSWVFRYQRQKRRRDIGLGAYPGVSLRAARQATDSIRMGLSQGIDPLAARSAPVLEPVTVATFQTEAVRYIDTHKPSWRNGTHGQQWNNTLRDYVYPLIGDMPVAEVDTDQVLQVLLPIWQVIPETASRVRNRIELVLDAAKALKLRDGENPARWRCHLDKLLPKRRRAADPHPAMPLQQVGSFVRQLDSLSTNAARACELIIFTACRSGEVCNARWDEIDMETGLWTIDGARMKAGKTHRVPLSAGALEVLRQQEGKHPVWVFPNARRSKGIPGNALNRVMAELSVSDYVPHGFRSTFRTWAAEHTQYQREVCEMALAHGLEDKVEAAYNRGDLFKKRRQLMADWEAFIQEHAQIELTATPQAACG